MSISSLQIALSRHVYHSSSRVRIPRPPAVAAVSLHRLKLSHFITPTHPHIHCCLRAEPHSYRIFLTLSNLVRNVYSLLVFNVIV